MDNEDLNNVSLESSPLASDSYDIGSDGSLNLNSNNNLSDSSLPDYSPLDSTDIAPLDNVNGSSGTNGDATNSINSMFNAPGLNGILSDITGGATDLADGLSGVIEPTQANSTANSTGISTGSLLLFGGGALLLLLLVAA